MPFLDANALTDDADGVAFLARALGTPDGAGGFQRSFGFDLPSADAASNVALSHATAELATADA